MELNKGQQKALKHSGKLGAGAKARKKLVGKEKIPVVMHEWKKGTLHSGSGDIVKSQKQAVAIALSEAGISKPTTKKATTPLMTKRNKRSSKTVKNPSKI